MIIKYYGHSCFGVTANGFNLLFDPFISGNEMAKEIDIDAIPCDFMLISHGHQDHILDAERIAKRTGCKIICAFEIHEWFNKKGLNNTHPMNVGGPFEFDFGTVRGVAAVHSSGLPDGSYGGIPMGFVVEMYGENEENTEGVFYFAGDTALTLDMQLIPMICPPLNFAILPIGSNFTMDYNDAVIASDFIQCNTIIACHYDTFGYIKIDHDDAHAAFEAEGKDLIFAKIGGELQLS
ncbi:MAG: metal-dependent hydrolase [Saprospiraceae bacterium]|nr:metal-dependent hydrolase [Saprospiraceae bacterium]